MLICLPVYMKTKQFLVSQLANNINHKKLSVSVRMLTPLILKIDTVIGNVKYVHLDKLQSCLLYTSDAADE